MNYVCNLKSLIYEVQRIILEYDARSRTEIYVDCMKKLTSQKSQMCQ